MAAPKPEKGPGLGAGGLGTQPHFGLHVWGLAKGQQGVGFGVMTLEPSPPPGPKGPGAQTKPSRGRKWCKVA